MVFPIFKDSRTQKLQFNTKNPPFSKAKMLNQRTGCPRYHLRCPLCYFIQTV